MATTSTGVAASLRRRKGDHLDICLTSDYAIESDETGFEQVRFAHRALPEIAVSEIDPSTRFLGHSIALPLMISCMTGGSHDGYRINRDLAQAAQVLGIPIGLGSIRVLFHDPQVLQHFQLKSIAPDVPVIANLSAAQVAAMVPAALIEMLRQLEVQAVAIHLNVGQELFQPDGDRDFRGLHAAIARFCERSTLPVIVKETGCGLLPFEVDELLACGVGYVDLAGAGGTNWIQVEGYRIPPHERMRALEFATWGNQTAVILEALGHRSERVIASGGIRSGLDVAKAIAMGAVMTACALPFIRALAHAGVEGVIDYARDIRAVLTAVMTLTASRSISELRRAALIKQPHLQQAARQLSQVGQRR